MIRERLAELINREQDLCVCGEAEDARQAIKLVQSLKPDLAIVDITLKDTFGLELIKDLKARHSQLPVLVLSMHDEAMYAERSLRAGARGYLNKQEASRNIIAAVRKILRGDVYVSEQMSARLLDQISGGRSLRGENPTDVLTTRELEIFNLLGSGATVRQIAQSLCISVKTVESHREHIKSKLKFKSSAELLRYAIELQLTPGTRQRP